MGRHEARLRQAISVERLVHWAYGIQRVERDCLSLGAAQSGTAAVLDYMRLGCRIDSSGAGARLAAAGSEVHPDALMVQRRVAGLGGLAAALLREHGRAGTQPDWRPLARHRFVPERWGDDGGAEVESLHGYEALAAYWPRGIDMPRVLRERIADRAVWRSKGDPMLRRVTVCAVRPADQPEAVEADRLAWSIWRGGLVTLWRHWRRPGGDLSAFVVSDELPMDAPWLDGEALRQADMRAAAKMGLTL